MLTMPCLQDEIDALASSRGDSSDPMARRLLIELLLQLTALASDPAASGVHVFAATNRIQVRVGSGTSHGLAST